VIQVICNICTKKLVGNPQLHYCQRCQPFAESYEKELNVLLVDNATEVQRKANKLRERFFQEHILPSERKLTAVGG
jgi:hypothetical protein